MTYTVFDDKLFPVICLEDEETGCTAEIYSFGALLNSFTIKNGNSTHNVIDGFTNTQDAKDNITNGFKSARLSPFVCRVKSGRYQFNGSPHAINKFFLGKEAIHGVLYDVPFSITQKGADDKNAYVTLAFEYNKINEGYPFPFHTAVTYTLQNNNTLLITTTVTNTGKQDMPLADGWHPYFTLGSKVNELLVQLNTRQLMVFDEYLLPTGDYINYNAFATPRHLGETFLDNCFVLDDSEKPACVLKNEANGLQLTIYAKQGYPYLQVYTPPHRNSIAVENLSGAPDAFNNGIGLIIAKPGEHYTFAAAYTLQLPH